MPTSGLSGVGPGSARTSHPRSGTSGRSLDDLTMVLRTAQAVLAPSLAHDAV